MQLLPGREKTSCGADGIGKLINRIHGSLLRWLAGDPRYASQAGGPLFLRTRVIAPAREPEDFGGFEFDYYGGNICLYPAFLRAFARLRETLGGPPWEEVVRLFLLHEGHHIGQGMGYRSKDIGRAGVALEAVDYDADVASIECCLGWRRHRAKAAFSRGGEMAALRGILGNLLAGISFFDNLADERPVHRMKERRLRRHLIWHFQHARACAAAKDLPADRLRLRERVVLELPGLVTTQERHNGHLVTFVDLASFHPEHEPELVIYAGSRVYRCQEIRFCADLLAALRTNVVERVSRVFHRLFEQHPELVPA
jgi:hypothetical protein